MDTLYKILLFQSYNSSYIWESEPRVSYSSAKIKIKIIKIDTEL